MNVRRTARTGPTPVRGILLIAGAAASLAAAPVLFPAPAAAAVAVAGHGQDLDDFYSARDGRPLWFEIGQASPAADLLLSQLKSASIDGLNPAGYDTDAVEKALRKAWGGDERAIRKADRLLSRAFVAYARDLRKNPASGLQYFDPQLPSKPPAARELLEQAAEAQSLEGFVRDMRWMNPAYAPLRQALVEGKYDDPRKRDILRINLARVRVLPSESRYLVVNAAAQRLYMYEGDKLAGSMKVVVGQQKDDRKTPMVAGYLRYASLNPYWNVPPDLVGDDVAVYVLKYGLNWLKVRGYEVLSDWTDSATPVDPATIDWQAVMDGKKEIRVRQKPGPRNVLGKVKYTFTNPFGVYLHDTSAKELLNHDTRLYSGGCIRLENASGLGEWLFGHELKATSDDPDIKVPLDKPVPVYVTYLTAVPDGSSITFLDDVYGWDERRLAEMGSGGGPVSAR